jgi:hypothetical protein
MQTHMDTEDELEDSVLADLVMEVLGMEALEDLEVDIMVITLERDLPMTKALTNWPHQLKMDKPLKMTPILKSKKSI